MKTQDKNLEVKAFALAIMLSVLIFSVITCLSR
jgi:hypothetical protein